MSQTFKLSPSGPDALSIQVTRWWASGSYRYTLHDDTLDQTQIVELFDLLDSVVSAALLNAVREKKGTL